MQYDQDLFEYINTEVVSSKGLRIYDTSAQDNGVIRYIVARLYASSSETWGPYTPDVDNVDLSKIVANILAEEN
ncbi:MAG: hypothetical protein Q4F66_01500 [Clostridium sp.]|nr:hypothetical protein [Clostridium sp.]